MDIIFARACFDGAVLLFRNKAGGRVGTGARPAHAIWAVSAGSAVLCRVLVGQVGRVRLVGRVGPSAFGCAGACSGEPRRREWRALGLRVRVGLLWRTSATGLARPRPSGARGPVQLTVAVCWQVWLAGLIMRRTGSMLPLSMRSRLESGGIRSFRAGGYCPTEAHSLPPRPMRPQPGSDAPLRPPWALRSSSAQGHVASKIRLGTGGRAVGCAGLA